MPGNAFLHRSWRLVALSCLVVAPLPRMTAPLKCVVLVHGAWVDGSGWKPVYDLLTKDGYDVYEARPTEVAAVIRDAAQHAVP
jgi:hypothetical protein